MLTQIPRIGDIIETPHPRKYRQFANHQLPEDTEYVVLGKVARVFSYGSVMCEIRMSDAYKQILSDNGMGRPKNYEQDHTAIIAKFYDGMYNNWVRVQDAGLQDTKTVI